MKSSLVKRPFSDASAPLVPARALLEEEQACEGGERAREDVGALCCSAPGAAHTQRETSSSALTSSLLSLDDMAVSRAGEERKKASVAGKTDGFALGALP